MLRQILLFQLMVVYFITAAIDIQGQSIKPYIGLHGGINFTQPQILDSYDIITLLDGEALQGRQYNPLFRNFGNQIGFSFLLEFSDHISIGLMPQMARYSYGYSSSMEFFSNDGTLASTTENISKQRLNYLNFPLFVQYTIRKADFSPYLIAGFSYGYLRNAQHDVVTNTTINTDGEELNFSQPTSDNYSSEFIHSKLSLLGGIGAFYDLTLFRLAADITYWYGLNNISHETNRFQNQTISGSTYDISDDIKLHHFILNVSFLFPINKQANRGSLDCVTPKKRR
jgi:hypothetical protein